MKNKMNATKLIKHKYEIQIINKQLPVGKYATKDGATTMNPYLTPDNSKLLSQEIKDQTS